ncbi:MAG: FecR family protein [Candidatus Sericytochromatia bacterium]|nr:FecR family protein [Candidatus Sericytochromatia bacterium]
MVFVMCYPSSTPTHHARGLVLAALVVLGPASSPTWALEATDPLHAVVTRVVRRVEWQRARTAVWQRAFVDTLLVGGDTLRTAADAKAELLYGDGSVSRIGSLTSLTLTGERRREVRLDAGTIWLHIRKGGAGMRVFTPGAVATVTGTELLVQVDPVRRATEVTVFEGAVNVTGDIGQLVRVVGGTTTRVPFQAPAAAPVPLDAGKLQQRSLLVKPLSVEPGGPGEATPPPPPVPGPAATPVPVDGGRPATVAPAVADPTAAPAQPPEPPAAASGGTPSARPDLKGQTEKLLDPRVINGSPTTGSVRVIIE